MGYSFKAILDFIEFSEDDEFFSEIGDFDLSKFIGGKGWKKHTERKKDRIISLENKKKYICQKKI